MRARMVYEIEEKENEAAILKEKNEEIQQYMNKLQASNNELQQFAYVVSHDLRTFCAPSAPISNCWKRI